MKKIILFIIVILFAGCAENKSSRHFLGFWEGPHPEDQNKKFYVHIQQSGDSVIADGYWTENNFYQSKFELSKISINSDSICFFIPAWNCNYNGVMNDTENIIGGFSCMGESFDSVNLRKKNEIAKYITLPKPDFSANYKYEYSVPEKLNDLLRTAMYQRTCDSVFIHDLNSEIIEGKYGRINSFLLIKNSELICEEYFYGYTGNDLHQIESSTKSITSLLIGIARDKQFIGDLNDPLFKIFPKYDLLKKNGFKNIEIIHLLTMSSGFVPNDDEIFRGKHDRITASINRDLRNKPGEKFSYDGGNTEILGVIIKKKTGHYADEFAAQNLFKPLKIDEFNWNIYKQDGFPSMAGSLWLKPRDMAKVGLMVLNNGQFNGKQIVSKEWIQESTSKKIETHIAGDDYAYQWWNIHLNSNGKVYNCIWANGWGSQFIYIVPELNVVIVTTGHNYENDSWAITKGIEKHLSLLD